ncbi:hypothetical protein DLM85_18335 [Hymenobacter edaphi]|uniref:CBM-cenC domain-containing protein n=2 Tax=Hymenobacter edaphi TaxID=2211146 RepID=A0A328BFJ8_9BACT|nr:hypothetical protein DLM85_18335 [Hymenobacter edaphi]
MLGGVCSSLLIGCAPQQPELPPLPPDRQPLMSSSFEGVAGWSAPANLPLLSLEHARTGRYSLKAGRGLEYSLSYGAALGAVVPAGTRRLRLTAWAYTERPTDAMLVLQLLDPAQEGRSLVYEKIELGRYVTKSGEWTPVAISTQLPADARPESQLKIYLWYPNALNNIYLDDVALFSEE